MNSLFFGQEAGKCNHDVCVKRDVNGLSGVIEWSLILRFPDVILERSYIQICSYVNSTLEILTTNSGEISEAAPLIGTSR